MASDLLSLEVKLKSVTGVCDQFCIFTYLWKAAFNNPAVRRLAPGSAPKVLLQAKCER